MIDSESPDIEAEIERMREKSFEQAASDYAEDLAHLEREIRQLLAEIRENE
jgi:hypothetical protein